MKIALLSPLPPEKNGIAGYADSFAAALQASGVELKLPLKGEGNFTAIKEVAAFVYSHEWSDIDLVHVELGGGRLREYLVTKALRSLYPNLLITATIHDPERIIWQSTKLPWPLSKLKSYGLTYKLAMLLVDPWTIKDERKMASTFSHVVTLTNTGATSFAKRMRLSGSKISVIPHGNSYIEPKELPPLEPLKLLYFGFIYKGKGIEDLIDALSLVVNESPPLGNKIKLTLAGGCSPDIAFGQKKDYLSELKAQVERLGLKDLIHWELNIADSEIANVIQANHVVVLPYHESKKLKLLGDIRGTSGALSWAIACGRGVIASDTRSFAEEVSEGNGAVYPQGDVTALAKHIKKLSLEPKRLISWADKAHEIAQKREWQKVAVKFKALFNSLIVRSVE